MNAGRDTAALSSWWVPLRPAKGAHGERPRFRFAASPGERAAIAKDLGLLEVARLEADVGVVPDPAGEADAAVCGEIAAEIVQACVVTLKPVRQKIAVPFARRYVQRAAPRGGKRHDDDALDIDPLADDPPEPVGGSKADIAAAVLEELALAVDPYPHHPDARPVEPAQAGEEASPASPFAVLKGMKNSPQEKD